MSRGKAGWLLVTLLACSVVFGSVVFADDVPTGTILEPGPTFRCPHVTHLSFSDDEVYLACSSVLLPPINVFAVETQELVWQWLRPELLSTSLGDLVWPPLYYVGRAGQRRPEVSGWLGPALALFVPGDRQQLVVVHHPGNSGGDLIIHEPGGVSTRQGGWELGTYLHYYRGAGFDYAWTLELQGPQPWQGRRQTPANPIAAVTSVVFSTGGGLMATCDRDGILTLWSGDSLLRVVQADRGPLEAAAFSPQGDVLATVGPSGVVRLWATKGLELVAELPGHAVGQRDPSEISLQFSPDGSRLLSAVNDGTVRVWNVEEATCENRIVLPPELGQFPHFTFAGDNNWVYATGNPQRAARQGKLNQQAVLARLDLDSGVLQVLDVGPGRFFWAVTYSPRGNWLAVADSKKGEVLTWRLQPPTNSPTR